MGPTAKKTKAKGGRNKQISQTAERVPTGQVLHFAVAETTFCVALQHIIRVFPIVKFRYVPGGPEYLRGLITLEGKNLPLIDLADRLNLSGSNQYHLETPILLCKHGNKTAGLIVDEVYGVDRVREENLQMRPLFDHGSVVPFDAAIESDWGTSLLLNMHSIVDIDLSLDIESLVQQTTDPRQTSKAHPA